VIPKDLEKLRWLGNKVWKCQLETKEPTEVILWDASTPEPGPQSLSLRLQRTGVTKEVKDLVREIHEEVCLSVLLETFAKRANPFCPYIRRIRLGQEFQTMSKQYIVVGLLQSQEQRTLILLPWFSPTARFALWDITSLTIYSRSLPRTLTSISNIWSFFIESSSPPPLSF
jgi:hypothetical protein